MSRSILIVVVALGLLAACSGQPPAESASRTAVAEEPADAPDDAPARPGPRFEAKLAGADLADGDADHVVSLCPGCGLAMEGSHEHALPVGDYSLHFCSDRCKEEFARDVEASLVALTVPEQDTAVEPTN